MNWLLFAPDEKSFCATNAVFNSVSLHFLVLTGENNNFLLTFNAE